jgi:predicted small integral membrane protein
VSWDDAVAVLREWEGRAVVIVPILDPGISLTPFAGALVLAEPKAGVLRVRVEPHDEPYISLFRATFISAGWVPGREDRGLSIVQGGTRVDVFVDEAGS